MRRRFVRRYALLLLLLLAIPCAGRGQTAPVALNGLGRATLPLDGAWQFQTGDNMAWASPAFDDSAWQPIQVGRSWESQGHRDYTGFAWYRRHIAIPPGTPAGMNLALFLPGVDDAAEVYWNGRLVGSYGKVPPHPVWYATQSPQTYSFGPAQSGVLAIRVWSAPIVYLNSSEQGGLWRTPRIGTTEGIAALATAERYRWLQGNQFDFAVCLVCAIIGLLALSSWLRDRTRWMLFWLAIPMLKPLVQLVVFDIPGFSTFRLAYGSIGEAVAITDVAIWFLLFYLLDLRSHARLLRWTKILAFTTISLTLVDTAMVLLDWTRLFPRQFVYIDVASTIPIELLEMYVLIIVGFALRKRLDAARWLLAIASVVSALETGISDIGGLGIRWTHWTLHHQLYRPLFTIAGAPINVATLVELFLLVSILYAAWRYSVEQNQRKNVLEQEFRSAQEIQQILIPEELPAIAGYTLTSAYLPAQEVGGDFFQIIPLGGESGSDSGRVAIVVLGDVSGKGLKAAMTVSLLVGAIRSTVEATQDPAEILAALNRRLYGRMQGGFATCLVLRLDSRGRGTLANAGHLPPFLNGSELQLTPALPLGLLPDAEYETSSLHLAVGERLILYTDGVLEARNAAGELFGFARIAEISSKTSEQIAKAAQKFGQDDDITVLTLTLAPAAAALG
jgi:hypothetical protein